FGAGARPEGTAEHPRPTRWRPPPRDAAPAHALDHRLALWDPGTQGDRSPGRVAALEAQMDDLEHGIALLVRDVRGSAHCHRVCPAPALLSRPVCGYADAPRHRLGVAARAGVLAHLQPGTAGVSIPGTGARTADRPADGPGHVPASRGQANGVRDRVVSRRRYRESRPVRVRPDYPRPDLRVLSAGARRRGYGVELEYRANLASSHVGWDCDSPGSQLLQKAATHHQHESTIRPE